jgi:hypothetical protein
VSEAANDQSDVIAPSDRASRHIAPGAVDNGEYRVAGIGWVDPCATANARAAGDGPVSLRDMPATVVELSGQGRRSLAATWTEQGPAGSRETSPSLSELDAPIEDGSSDRQTATRGAVQAIAVEESVYIRHQDGTEELYDLEADPGELLDQSDQEQARPRLEQCRRILGQATRTEPAVDAQLARDEPARKNEPSGFDSARELR